MAIMARTAAVSPDFVGSLAVQGQSADIGGKRV